MAASHFIRHIHLPCLMSSMLKLQSSALVLPA
jgi:hypothetical protein